MAGHRLKRGDAIGPYRIVEDISQDPSRPLYLSRREDLGELFLVLESKPGAGQPSAASPGYSAFVSGGVSYVAFQAEGTSADTLMHLGGPLDWRFVVPRWTALVEEIGYLHARGQLFQQGKPLDLQSVLIGHDGRLLSMSFQQSAGGSPFAAPELGSRPPSKASDVYGLGAALLSLLGADAAGLALEPGKQAGGTALNPRVLSVLKKATDPDPAKRYPDANAFARALAAISPAAAPAIKEQKPAGPRRIPVLSLVFAGILLVALLAAASLYLGWFRFDPGSLTAKPVIAIPAGPTGDYAFQVSNFSITPDKVVHLDVTLSQGGKALDPTTPLEWDASLNGQKALSVSVNRVEPADGKAAGAALYQLSFDVSSLPSVTGTYRVAARLIGTTLSQTWYYEEPTGTGPRTDGTPIAANAELLAGVTIAGMQIDTEQYPNLTLYFTAGRSDGAAVRLYGPLFVQVEQDNHPVGTFLLRPYDPAADPVTAALAVDVSGSMQGDPLSKAQQAAVNFVNAMNPADSACIYSFSTTLTRLQDCTTNRKEATDAIGQLKAGGDTALYDTLLRVSQDLSKVNGRKAIVLLTDGADTASRASNADSLNGLRKTNIPVFGIGLRSADFKPSVLQGFASDTSGYYLEAPTAADLQKLYAQVNAQLQNQYRLDLTSLFPANTAGMLTVRLISGNSRVEASKYFSLNK